ncbi:hypothetical protein Vadar_009566 [Vaccinium darrowii]|uniref:Uncharacterized protein n=1 Tax=Vaccinium darrowii TaxID=229202 RepID=A0ACB7ZBF5_9ERIC|nr:hypothetical protein Vadar_009566 [Vaccinium darrowii]
MATCYLASTKAGASTEEWGQNGESETTFPMMIRVGDTNSANAISSARSFSSARTCEIGKTVAISHSLKKTEVCPSFELRPEV